MDDENFETKMITWKSIGLWGSLALCDSNNGDSHLRKTTARVPQMPRTIAEMIWMAYADGADLEQCHPLMLNSFLEKEQGDISLCC